ncbi:MAG: hypothetical protein SPI72_00480 [Porphyromonas sp.]|nr:hypothetical protein [Porphyromonas sp.]
MKRIIPLLLFIGSLCTLSAQTKSKEADEYRAAIEHAFAKIDKKAVPHGILRDYAFEHIPIDQYDGVLRDSNYSDLSSQMALYTSLLSGIVGQPSENEEIPSLSQYMEQIKQAKPNALNVLLFRYSHFRENAIEKGYLRVENNQIIPQSSPDNMYAQAELFSVAPQTIVWNKREIELQLLPEQVLTNLRTQISEIRVSWDKDEQFEPLPYNKKVTHTYATNGVKTLRFKCILNNRKELLSQTNILIQVREDLHVLSSRKEDKIPFYSQSGGKGAHSGGTLYIKYANPDKILRKPFIIAEGYEPPIPSLKNTDLTKFLKFFLGENDSETEIDKVFDGYDVLYLDYRDPADDIQRNAALFKEVIRWVNKNKAKDASDNVVLGYSMGGLVAAMALREMEIAQEDHDTFKYISLDSPHHGANVPIGALELVNYIPKSNLLSFATNMTFVGRGTVYSLLGDILSCPATQQLLIRNPWRNSQQVHNDFMAKYHKLGLPQKTENIAFTNGSMKGTRLFSEKTYLFRASADFRIGLLLSFWPVYDYPGFWKLLNLVPGSKTFSMRLIITSSAFRKEICHFDVTHTKTLLGIDIKSFKIDYLSVPPPSPILPLDGGSGGTFTLSSQGYSAHDFTFKFDDYWIPILCNLLGGFNAQSDLYQDRFNFVPRNSALYLDDWTKDLDEEFDADELVRTRRSPFHRIHGRDNDSGGHTDLEFFRKKLQDELNGLEAHIPILDGPDVVKASTDPYTYKVANPLPDLDYEFTLHSALQEKERTRSSITVAQDPLHPKPKHLYVGARAYRTRPDKTKEYVGKRTFFGSYVGTPRKEDISVEQLKMYFEIDKDNLKEYLLPAVLVQWKNYGGITDAKWHSPDLNSYYNTQDRSEEYATYGALSDTPTSNNEVALVEVYEHDLNSGSQPTPLGAASGTEYPNVFNPPGPKPEPNPNIPDIPKHPADSLHPCTRTVSYVFVPTFGIPEKFESIQLQVKLSNSLGEGEYSDPIRYERGREIERQTIPSNNETYVLLAPSVINDETIVFLKEYYERYGNPGAKLYMEIWNSDTYEKVMSMYVFNSQVINLSSLAPGRYFARFISHNRAFIQHFEKR